MHQPVMLREVLDGLAPRPGRRLIDGTLGGGGHAEALLELIGREGVLLGIDRDPGAIERARDRLSGWGGACVLAHGNFADIRRLAEERGLSGVDGILLDLGMSSDQVDAPERGFSFAQDGPLDMRMDPTQGATAADLVNDASEEELARILWELGGERAARRIARALVAERQRKPIRTTGELARLVEDALGGRRGRIHPATKTFMAIRMAVNQELECIERGLEDGLTLLRPGGRMAVLTFHSIEDRMVKRCFKRHVGHWESLQAGGRAWRGDAPAVRAVHRKPLTPAAEEVARNPRARSAKLRVVERCDHGETKTK